MLKKKKKNINIRLKCGICISLLFIYYNNNLILTFM